MGQLHNVKSNEELEAINKEMDSEMAERIRLDLYLRAPGFEIHSIRNHSLGRIRDLRSSREFDRQFRLGRQGKQAEGPTDGEIIVGLFINYIIEVHPKLSTKEDYERVFTLTSTNRALGELRLTQA